MDLDLGWHTLAQKRVIIDYWMERQRGVCCLCSDPDLPMDPYYRQGDQNPLAATLEHLIPKRDGGPNIARNVRLAHKMCNSALGALWEVNRQREARGEHPHNTDSFLAEARRRNADFILGRRNRVPASDVHASRMAVELASRPVPPGWAIRPDNAKAIPSSLASALALGKPIGLERGSTLPGFTPAPDRVPQPAKPAPRAKDLLERKAEKVRRPVCTRCGSVELTRDASLRWDIRNGGWVIAEHREGYDCRACDADCVPRWEFVNRESA